MITDDQAVGMYLGMAVGDMLGAPHEFQDPREVTGIETGGVHDVSVGEWTDDTAMARCITDVYINHLGLNNFHLAKNFLDWYRTGKFGTRDHCFDIGNQTRKSLEYFEQYRQIDTDDLGYASQSWGNGCIMRLAPVIVARRHDYGLCIGDAIRQGSVTHPSATCAGWTAIFAGELFAGKCFNEDTINLLIEGNLTPRNRGDVQSTHNSAWYSVLRCGNFRDAVLDAVGRGDDADTVGAVAGMIAGRLWGASAIPSEWLESLMMRDELTDEVNRLMLTFKQ